MERLRKIWPRIRSPLMLRRVKGHSMQPTIKDGQIILASNWLPVRRGVVTVAEIENIEVIKRLEINDSGYLLSGDNGSDTINYMLKDKNSFRGVVIWPRGTEQAEDCR